MLREYIRVLIKRKWMVLSVVAGIFMAVAVASLRQTPIYEASGQIVVNRGDFESHNFQRFPAGRWIITIRPNWIPKFASCRAI